MKQLMECIKKAKSFINEDEKYIIFNDGKAVDSNVDDSIDITVDDDLAIEDYGIKDIEKLTLEIKAKAPFKTLISINNDVSLKIIHICDEEKYMDYQIEVKKGVKAKITNLYTFVVNETNIKLDILCNNRSSLTYYDFYNFSDEMKSITSFYLLNKSTLDSKSLALNRDESQMTTNLYMLEENSKADMLSVTINSTGETQENDYHINHKDIKTTSVFNSYCIAKNDSKIKTNLVGKIDKGAKKADLREKTKGIILDDKSEIIALPSLLIDEFDVIANHGATIGSINQDDLYYLMSRGLTKERSEDLMVSAFVAPYFKDTKETETTIYIKELIEKEL